MTKIKADQDVPNSEDSGDEDVREDENLEDNDVCSAAELEQHFQLRYRIADESVVSLKKDYVLQLSHNSTFTKIAAGLSNGSIKLFDISPVGLTNHSSIETTQASSSAANVCGVKFLKEAGLENCLLVGTTEGTVKLFDVRTQAVAAVFQEDPNHSYGSDDYLNKIGIKNLTCFDCNANNRILCTGTEQYQNNVFLIFYDLRERKQLGGYYESHQDDVTSVRFHDTNPDLLCSGSTDGLINIFDIQENEEDEALQTTINTESSVQKVKWHKDANGKDVVSCITHTNDFKAYEAAEGDVVVEFERQKITEQSKRANAANCNLIDAHNTEDDSVFLLVGTNSKKGEILRSLRMQHKDLLPLADFRGNKQIIRESLYHESCIITAGESGIVSMWTPQSVDQATTGISDVSQMKSKKKSNKRTTPY